MDSVTKKSMSDIRSPQSRPRPGGAPSHRPVVRQAEPQAQPQPANQPRPQAPVVRQADPGQPQIRTQPQPPQPRPVQRPVHQTPGAQEQLGASMLDDMEPVMLPKKRRRGFPWRGFFVMILILMPLIAVAVAYYLFYLKA